MAEAPRSSMTTHRGSGSSVTRAPRAARTTGNADISAVHTGWHTSGASAPRSTRRARSTRLPRPPRRRRWPGCGSAGSPPRRRPTRSPRPPRRDVERVGELGLEQAAPEELLARSLTHRARARSPRRAATPACRAYISTEWRSERPPRADDRDEHPRRQVEREPRGEPDGGRDARRPRPATTPADRDEERRDAHRRRTGVIAPRRSAAGRRGTTTRRPARRTGDHHRGLRLASAHGRNRTFAANSAVIAVITAR